MQLCLRFFLILKSGKYALFCLHFVIYTVTYNVNVRYPFNLSKVILCQKQTFPCLVTAIAVGQHME